MAPEPPRKTEKKALALDDAEGKPTCLLLKVHCNHGRTTAVCKSQCPVVALCETKPTGVSASCTTNAETPQQIAAANSDAFLKALTHVVNESEILESDGLESGVLSFSVVLQFLHQVFQTTPLFWGHSWQEVGMYNFLLHG